jgi:hypothetical protein
MAGDALCGKGAAPGACSTPDGLAFGFVVIFFHLLLRSTKYAGAVYPLTCVCHARQNRINILWRIRK